MMTAVTSERKKQILGNRQVCYLNSYFSRIDLRLTVFDYCVSCCLQYYECPLYTQPKRTGLHYVTKVMMRTDRDPTHWTVRGVAMLCDIGLS